MTDKTEFTHADILRAFADGKKVESYDSFDPIQHWVDCNLKIYAAFYNRPEMRFRIAPDLISFAAAIKGGKYTWLRPSYSSIDDCKNEMSKNPLQGYETFSGFIKITISSETGKLSVEVVEDES